MVIYVYDRDPHLILLYTVNSYQKLNAGARLDKYQTPNAFILMITKAMDDTPMRASGLFVQYWKNTTSAGLDRKWSRSAPRSQILLRM